MTKVNRWTKLPTSRATKDRTAPKSPGRKIEDKLETLQEEEFEYKYFEPGEYEEPPLQAYKSPMPYLRQMWLREKLG